MFQRLSGSGGDVHTRDSIVIIKHYTTEEVASLENKKAIDKSGPGLGYRFKQFIKSVGNHAELFFMKEIKKPVSNFFTVLNDGACRIVTGTNVAKSHERINVTEQHKPAPSVVQLRNEGRLRQFPENTFDIHFFIDHMHDLSASNSPPGHEHYLMWWNKNTFKIAEEELNKLTPDEAQGLIKNFNINNGVARCFKIHKDTRKFKLKTVNKDLVRSYFFNFYGNVSPSADSPKRAGKSLMPLHVDKNFEADAVRAAQPEKDVKQAKLSPVIQSRVDQLERLFQTPRLNGKSVR